MSSFPTIRDNLKTALATISGLRAHDTIPELVNPPAAVVGPPDSIIYDMTFGGVSMRWTLVVRVYVAKVSERTAQDKLDGYIAPTGSGSIKAVIESDKTLSGAVDTCRVTECRNYGVFRVGDIDYLGAEWVVDVITST